jgi:hypothetical protein
MPHVVRQDIDEDTIIVRLLPRIMPTGKRAVDNRDIRARLEFAVAPLRPFADAAFRSLRKSGSKFSMPGVDPKRSSLHLRN